MSSCQSIPPHTPLKTFIKRKKPANKAIQNKIEKLLKKFLTIFFSYIRAVGAQVTLKEYNTH